MGENWNLQTNLKNKPNAQGTLFSGGKSQMNPARRYKKGYTPERQKAVNEAVHAVVHYKMDANGEPTGGDLNTSQTRHVFETLKRSSAPVSDMKGLSVEVMSPRLNYMGTGDRTLYSAHGYYVGSPKGWTPRGRMTLSEEAKGPTIIHELGHHASNLAENEHADYEGGPRSIGQEEGFADAYADRHTPAYRISPNGDIPRAGRRDRFDIADMTGKADYTPHPEQLFDDAGVLRRDHFAEGYMSSRPMEGRRPNRDDLQRAAEARANRAPQKETLF